MTFNDIASGRFPSAKIRACCDLWLENARRFLPEKIGARVPDQVTVVVRDEVTKLERCQTAGGTKAIGEFMTKAGVFRASCLWVAGTA